MPNEIKLGFDDDLTKTVQSLYFDIDLNKIVEKTLSIMTQKLHDGIDFVYFPDAIQIWNMPKSVSIYVVNHAKGRAVNLAARGKDYATNVLSYPSELPTEVIALLGEIELGELVLCHEVVLNEADEQNKSFKSHLTHLIVHGLLHLLGFDHEISDTDADQMEGFEIEILAQLGIDNPYLEPQP